MGVWDLPATTRIGCAAAAVLLAFGPIGAGEATAAPGALWTTPLSAAGSFVYGSPTGGFLLNLWDGKSLDPVVGTASDAQVALGDHDAGVAPAFDSAGDVYRWSSTTGSTEQFALEKDSPSGQVLWRTPVNAEQPHDLVLGSSHDLYASYFSNEDGWHLLRLDTSTGQVLWNDAGPEGVPEPTPEGVALVSAGQVQLVGSDESSGGTVTYVSGNTAVLYSVTHNDQGDILALNLPRWASQSCGYTAGPATVTELGPSGTQLWTREVTMSGCIHPTVAALPNGSWALSDQESGAILGLSGTDGSTLWTASTGPGNYGPFILGADANGDIYAEQNLATNCVPEPANTANCQGEDILQINGATGSFSSVLQLIDDSVPNTITLGLEDMSPGRDTNTPASIAPGRLFTVEDDLIGNPGSFTNSLWSFNGYSLSAGAPYPTPPDEGGGGSGGDGGTGGNHPPAGNRGGGTTGGSNSEASGLGTSPSGCPPYMVIDSRGSGASNGTISPPGAAFVAEFRRLHPSSHVAVLWNPYPAVGLWGSVRAVLNLVGAGLTNAKLGTYHNSVVGGEKWLQTAIISEIVVCPTTNLLLTGYSQGAQVTADVYQKALPLGVLRHIAAVALFGDPRFNPKDKVVDQGNKYDRNKVGILGTRSIFGRGLPVVSYCHRHDPICQEPESPFTLKKYGLKRHGDYPSDGVSAADYFSR